MSEDPLRIMRAMRFSATLGFSVSAHLMRAMHELKDSLLNISQERITSEFCKIAETDRFWDVLYLFKDVYFAIVPELKETDGFDQKNPYHKYDVFEHTVHALRQCKSNDLITKLALFFHDIGKPNCAEVDRHDPNRLHFYGHGEVSAKMTDEIMRRMKFDNETRKAVVELVYYHDSPFHVSEKHIRRWLHKIGPKQFERLIDLRMADISAQNLDYLPERLDKVKKVRALYEDMMKKEQCFTISDLAVNGRDLIEIGYKQGKELGATLNKLLQLVIDGEAENDEISLLEIAARRLEMATRRLGKEEDYETNDVEQDVDYGK